MSGTVRNATLAGMRTRKSRPCEERCPWRSYRDRARVAAVVANPLNLLEFPAFLASKGGGWGVRRVIRARYRYRACVGCRFVVAFSFLFSSLFRLRPCNPLTRPLTLTVSLSLSRYRDRLFVLHAWSCVVVIVFVFANIVIVQAMQPPNTNTNTNGVVVVVALSLSCELDLVAVVHDAARCGARCECAPYGVMLGDV